MTDTEALEELEFLEGSLTDEEVYLLESRLALRAAALGWTGDPLRQPPAVAFAGPATTSWLTTSGMTSKSLNLRVLPQ